MNYSCNNYLCNNCGTTSRPKFDRGIDYPADVCPICGHDQYGSLPFGDGEPYWDNGWKLTKLTYVARGTKKLPGGGIFETELTIEAPDYRHAMLYAMKAQPGFKYYIELKKPVSVCHFIY